jgi:hypothetical protein
MNPPGFMPERSKIESGAYKVRTPIPTGAAPMPTLGPSSQRAKSASEVMPKFISPSDPAAQWTGAMRGPAFFAWHCPSPFSSPNEFNGLIGPSNFDVGDNAAPCAVFLLYHAACRG